MKLQQLRSIVAMVQNNLNMSDTAAALCTSQPGVSKQIRQLEDEVGVDIFERQGKQVVAVTPAGRDIIRVAEAILAGVEDIRTIGRSHADPQAGELRIAVSPTPARYGLPAVIEAFHARFPRVDIRLHPGTPAQMASLLDNGDVDLVIATEGLEHYGDSALLPCSRWRRCIVVPPDHPLCRLETPDTVKPDAVTPDALSPGAPMPTAPTLDALADYPLITGVLDATAHSAIGRAFKARRLDPRVVLTATDADVIKTCVRKGLGVGILARRVFESGIDDDLVVFDAGHLFEDGWISIGLHRHRRLPPFVGAFIEQFAPHLDAQHIEAALAASSREARDALFANVSLAVDLPVD